MQIREVSRLCGWAGAGPQESAVSPAAVVAPMPPPLGPFAGYVPDDTSSERGPARRLDPPRQRREECDDNNIFSGDGCSADCKACGGRAHSVCDLEVPHVAPRPQSTGGAKLPSGLAFSGMRVVGQEKDGNCGPGAVVRWWPANRHPKFAAASPRRAVFNDLWTSSRMQWPSGGQLGREHVCYAEYRPPCKRPVDAKVQSALVIGSTGNRPPFISVRHAWSLTLPLTPHASMFLRFSATANARNHKVLELGTPGVGLVTNVVLENPSKSETCNLETTTNVHL